MYKITNLLPIVFILLSSCTSTEEAKNQSSLNENISEIIDSTNHSKEEWDWGNWHAPNIWSNYPIDTTLVYSFEEAFKVASELKVLYINEPKQRENLPKEIVKLQELEELWLWVNISDVEGVFELLKELPKLKKLSIRELEYIPSNIDQLSNLEAISFHVGAFNKIHDNICNLKNLRYLSFYNSRKLKELPEGIGKLTELEYIDVAGTRITKFPQGMGICKKLRTITANACRINSIDSSICNLPMLSHFNLGANQIEILPGNLGNLTNLNGLDLGSNKLRGLPKSIEKMTKLHHIHIDHNNFKEFPLEIFSIKNLYSLWIHENEISNIPIKEISNSKIKRILIDVPEINKEELALLKKLKPNLKIIDQ